MEKVPSFDKLPEDEAQKLKQVFERAKKEVPYDFSIEEDSDTVMVRRTNEEGKEVGMGFTKVGDKIMFSDGNEYHFSEIVEARLKYPNENVLDAIQKLRKEKENKNNAEQTRP